jgi:hypothetical protein
LNVACIDAARTEIHVSEPLTPNTQTAMRTIL